MPRNIQIEDDFKTGEFFPPEQILTIGIAVRVHASPTGEGVGRTFEWLTKKTTEDAKNNLVYQQIKSKMAVAIGQIQTILDTFESEVNAIVRPN